MKLVTKQRATRASKHKLSYSNVMRIKPYQAALNFPSVVLHSGTRSGHFTTFRLLTLYYNVDYNNITEQRNGYIVSIWSTFLEFTYINWETFSEILASINSFGHIFDAKSLRSFQTHKYVIRWEQNVLSSVNQ